MLKRLWRDLRRALAGRRLIAARRRNEAAAEALDALLREVLKR